MNEKVSIITVVYNGADTIEQTIQSVLGQTYKNIEYIIIDGASTDGTQEIIGKYQNRIAYFISEKDKGIYDAMNKGIEHATGDVIGIINSDDWYEIDAVEKAVSTLNKYEADVIYGRIFCGARPEEMSLVPIYLLETLWYHMAISHPSVFVKKSIYDIYGLFNIKYKIAADYELMLRLYSNNVKFAFIDEVLAYFRTGGISQTLMYEMYMEEFSIACEYIGRCENRKEVMKILSQTGEHVVFNYELEKNPFVLSELLNNYFSADVSNIVIFGTGKWGIKCYYTLQNTNINIEYFIDNHKSEQALFGKKIRKPDDIIPGNKYILIAVANDTDEIVNQLKDLGEKNYVTIGRLRRELWDERRNIIGL